MKESEIPPISEAPQTYEDFRNKAKIEALDFIGTEGIREVFGEIYDIFDQLTITEDIERIRDYASELAKNLKDRGVTNLSIEKPDPLYPEYQTPEGAFLYEKLYSHYVLESAANRFQNRLPEYEHILGRIQDLIQSTEANGELLGYYVVNFSLLTISFFQDLGRIQAHIIDEFGKEDEWLEREFNDLNLLHSKIAPLEELCFLRNSTKLTKIQQNILYHRDDIYLTRLYRYMQGVISFEDGDIADLDNKISAHLQRWFETEGDFLNIDAAPKEMQDRLVHFMEIRDPEGAPFPTCIVGEALDELISGDIDEDERGRFMFLCTMRSLLCWDDDAYLSALYEEPS